jgi:hypothetical protein
MIVDVTAPRGACGGSSRSMRYRDQTAGAEPKRKLRADYKIEKDAPPPPTECAVASTRRPNLMPLSLHAGVRNRRTGDR